MSGFVLWHTARCQCETCTRRRQQQAARSDAAHGSQCQCQQCQQTRARLRGYHGDAVPGKRPWEVWVPLALAAVSILAWAGNLDPMVFHSEQSICGALDHGQAPCTYGSVVSVWLAVAAVVAGIVAGIVTLGRVTLGRRTGRAAAGIEIFLGLWCGIGLGLVLLFLQVVIVNWDWSSPM